MGRLSALPSVLLLVTAIATGLSACGSGGGADLLPGSTAKEINANLDQVRQLVGEGECAEAIDAAATIGTQVEELHDVDPKLKQALSEGASQLNTVVLGCEERSTTTATTEESDPEDEESELPENEKPVKPAKEKPEEIEQPEKTQEPPGHGGENPGNGKGPTEEGGGAPSGGVGPGTVVGE